MEMLPFRGWNPPPEPVFDPEIIPEEMDIFYKDQASFLPEGKTFDNLTPQEEIAVRTQYRFSPFRPGQYQGITGMGDLP